MEINGGPEQTVTNRTGQYGLAALAALALLEFDERDGRNIVKIWEPTVLAKSIEQASQIPALKAHSTYGPHFYPWDGERLGQVDLSERW